MKRFYCISIISVTVFLVGCKSRISEDQYNRYKDCLMRYQTSYRGLGKHEMRFCKILFNLPLGNK